MARPPRDNWVTRRNTPRDDTGQPLRWPLFSREQVEFLQKAFPARCIQRGESLEDHLRYSGKRELVDLISVNSEMTANTATALDLEEEEALLDTEAENTAWNQLFDEDTVQ